MKDWRTMALQWSNSVFCVKTVKKAMVRCMIGFGGEMNRGPFDHGLVFGIDSGEWFME